MKDQFRESVHIRDCKITKGFGAAVSWGGQRTVNSSHTSRPTPVWNPSERILWIGETFDKLSAIGRVSIKDYVFYGSWSGQQICSYKRTLQSSLRWAQERLSNPPPLKVPLKMSESLGPCTVTQSNCWKTEGNISFECWIIFPPLCCTFPFFSLCMFSPIHKQDSTHPRIDHNPTLTVLVIYMVMRSRMSRFII